MIVECINNSGTKLTKGACYTVARVERQMMYGQMVTFFYFVHVKEGFTAERFRPVKDEDCFIEHATGQPHKLEAVS